jgi:hypothetical protein
MRLMLSTFLTGPIDDSKHFKPYDILKIQVTALVSALRSLAETNVSPRAARGNCHKAPTT